MQSLTIQAKKTGIVRHGARFSPQREVLNGPAQMNLKEINLE